MARPMDRHRAGTRAGGPGAAPIALAGCVLTRPGAFGGGVEICAASPAPRGFPTRISEGLGVCLKSGPAHTVTCDSRALT